VKTRAARGLRTAVPALAAGCAHSYEDPTTTTYIVGAIFVLIGVALGVAIIIGLNKG
jgi:hypothetical protein